MVDGQHVTLKNSTLMFDQWPLTWGQLLLLWLMDPLFHDTLIFISRSWRNPNDLWNMCHCIERFLNWQNMPPLICLSCCKRIPGAMLPPTASSVQGYIQVSRASTYTKSRWPATRDFKADSVAYTTIWLATHCVVLGRFHIEMGALCCKFKWLTSKGWTAYIIHSQVL